MGSSPSVSPATFQQEMDFQKKRNGESSAPPITAADGSGTPTTGLGPVGGANYGIDPTKDDWYGSAIQGEVRRRRRLLKDGLLGGEPVDAAPDAADAILRDVQTGKLRRARGGSTASALGTYAPATLLGGVQ